jgi:hypothetical protein
MRFLFLSALITVALCVFVFRHTGDITVTAVITHIKRVHTAQVDFYSRHGRYATSMTELSHELAIEQPSGYRLTLEGHGNSYVVRAEPTGSSGQALFSDETMIIRRARGGAPATAESEVVE